MLLVEIKCSGIHHFWTSPLIGMGQKRAPPKHVGAANASKSTILTAVAIYVIHVIHFVSLGCHTCVPLLLGGVTGQDGGKP